MPEKKIASHLHDSAVTGDSSRLCHHEKEKLHVNQ